MPDEKAKTRQDVRALLLSMEGEPFNVGEVSRLLGVQWGVVSRVVAHLEAEGLVTRILRDGKTLYAHAKPLPATPENSAANMTADGDIYKTTVQPMPGKGEHDFTSKDFAAAGTKDPSFAEALAAHNRGEAVNVPAEANPFITQ